MVCLCVIVSVFKYPRDRSLVFSETLHKVADQLSKGVLGPLSVLQEGGCELPTLDVGTVY